jgi:hypothetical protein
MAPTNGIAAAAANAPPQTQHRADGDRLRIILANTAATPINSVALAADKTITFHHK